MLANNKLHSGTQLLKLDKSNQDKEINASRNLTLEVMKYFSKVATRAASVTEERKNLFPKIAKFYIQGLLEKAIKIHIMIYQKNGQENLSIRISLMIKILRILLKNN